MLSLNLRDFPEELHYKAKIQAAVERITLKDLIIKAITEYLENKQKEVTNGKRILS